MHIPRDLRVAKTLPDLIYRADVDSINYIINAPDSCRVTEKFTTDLHANSDLAFRHRFSFFIFHVLLLLLLREKGANYPRRALLAAGAGIVTADFRN